VPDRRTLLAALATASARLRASMLRQLTRAQQRSNELSARLQRAHPGSRLRQQAQRLDELDMRLRRAWEKSFTRATGRLLLAQRGLDAISPLATLSRGYAIVTRADGSVVQDAQALAQGDLIEARLAHGRVQATVKSTRN
jgi:exodeoxyribonuclease VII large subunit